MKYMMKHIDSIIEHKEEEKLVHGTPLFYLCII